MNHKSAFVITMLTATLLTVCLIVSPVSAQEGEGGSIETFDDSELPGWERSPEVTVTDGTMKINPGSFAFKGGAWADLTLSVKVRYTGPGVIIIHYCASDTGSYNLHITEEGAMLERVENEVPSMLGEMAVESMQAGSWMTLKIVKSGSQHQVYIDEELTLTANDPNPLSAGAIGFAVHGESAGEFDDMALSGTQVAPGGGETGGEPVPPGQEPQPSMGEQETAPGQVVTTPAAAPAEDSGGLFEGLFAAQADPVSLQTFVINLLLATVMSYILSQVYIHWGSSLSNRRKFGQNFLLITITTTFIILVVRSSIALSLGLVGALSIVRFRTAVKEPEELAYLFFAIGLGIGLGDNQRLVTMLAFAVAIIILGLMRLLRKPHADVNLHLSVASYHPQKIDLEQMMSVLKPHCSKLKLLRFDENEKTLEMSFVVEFRKVSNLSEAKTAIRELSGTAEITFLDNKGIW